MDSAQEIPPAPRTPSRKPRRGDELTLRVEAFDARGRGFGHERGMLVRVHHALPGELVRASVVRRRRDEIDALVLERLEPGVDAITPRCAHFGACGGCSFQDLEYRAQLEGLRHLVEREFAAQGLLAGVSVEPVIPATDLWSYRNKMEFTFGSRRWIAPGEPESAAADFALGLHAANVYTKVIDIRSCSIQHPEADAILGSVRELARERGLSPWDVRAHTGLLRHLVIRRAQATGEILVNLVTSEAAEDRIDAYVHALLARHPSITSFVQNVTARASSTAVGEWERVIHGPGFIREQLGDLWFRISANSFFQTNTRQAEALFGLVREEAALTGSEVVHDLYSGTGSIALSLARSAREVVAFEETPSSVADARRNAELNGLSNVLFVEGDVLEAIDRSGASAGGERLSRPDVCIVDPPRAGLHPRLVPRLIAIAPARVVYVSCNPATAARDLALFVNGGYRIERIRPIDMFPHTPHVECVISLARRAGATPEEGAT